MNIPANNKRGLAIIIGKAEHGGDLIIDLPIIKHLLIGGTTGSGKSTLLHNVISTLLANNSPDNLRFILIDPKRVELPVYNKVPHLLTPVITEPKRAVLALKWVVKEMFRRFDVLEQNDCRNIDDYNGTQTMPHIVIVVDEFSDIMQAFPKETEEVVLKIAQMGYAVGVYLLLSTSRPSAKVFTTSIRDAVNARIGLKTASVQDSKLILGVEDAVRLGGAGDMLFRDGLKYPIHGQVRWISDEEVKSFTSNLRKTYKGYMSNDVSVDDVSGETHDDMYEGAREAVISAGKASTSYIQRKLGIGYSRAAQLMDMLESNGVIEAAKGSKPRGVIVQE